MSRIVEFYRGEAADAAGRYLKELWAWSDEELEEVHDFIQWMFPLEEPSRFNPDAPLLSDEDIAAFQGDPLLKSNLRRSLERILTFLGLALMETGEVATGANFSARVPDVWAAPNHNWLRITRILRSLTLLGLEEQAAALYRRLEAIYTSRRFPITAETFAHWSAAVGK